MGALDDSGDEASPAPKKPVSQKKPATSASSAPAKKDSRRNNNDRNTRGGRGPPKARDGKRTYDRRSGTGRGKEIKKGGGGARNWGSDKADARKAEGTVDEENVPASGEEGQEVAKSEEEAVVVEEPKEPEVVTKTFDEYMEEKKKAVEDNPFFQAKELREVDNEFSGAKASKIVEEDFLIMGSGKALRKKGTKKESGEKVQLNFRVGSRPGGDGGGRRDDGGRGRGRGRGGDRRGGRGRGGGRGGRGGGGGAPKPALDASAFPSLS